ncbi:MAG: Mrp/NBP35 family ATP-binding protein [Peptococcaceae bacterium]|nr:Mrp/NBP35 family ATP-binding protein [Peptococcaceae bacterium]
MSQCEGCASASSCGGSCPSQEPTLTDAQKHTNIKHVIVCMSGKGGVGKSSFSSILAIALKNRGFAVGLMDADITGPSIPKLFGVNEQPQVGEFGVEPVKSKKGISLMSMNFLLPHDDDPVVWRGAMITGVVQQFITDICWGDLDYLVVDLPPGTGDVPLTVMQNLNVSGALIVTTPQGLSNMVVRKGLKMLDLMNVPALGIAENMSYIRCGNCGEEIKLFGESHVQETCDQFQLPLVGQFPLDPQLSEMGDAGKIEDYDGEVLSLLTENLDVLLKGADEK